MTIDRDVILDLMPLYRSGLASPPTRALVEAWLADHPSDTSLDTARSMFDQPATMRAAFERARELSRWRRRLFAIAVGFTIGTLATEIRFGTSGGIAVRLLAFDHPLPFGLLGAAALLAWIGYWRLTSRLN